VAKMRENSIPGMILARFISTFGSILTAASIPLYLIQINNEFFIPYNVMGFALGKILGTKFLLPRFSRFSDKKTLIICSLFPIFILLSFLIFLFFDQEKSILFLPLLVFFASLFGTVNDSVAYACISKEKISDRLLNIDSTLTTLARISSPGVAAILLKIFDYNLSKILIFDIVTFVVSGLLFFFVFKKTKADKQKVEINHFSMLKKINLDPQLWIPLILVGFGASAYNAGAMIHLKGLGLTTDDIALFSIVQNIGMFLTGAFLIKYSQLTQKKWPSLILAFIGLLGISLSINLVYASLSTFIMAVGMVLFMQGTRLEISRRKINHEEKKFEFGMFATLNSSMTFMGSLLLGQLTVITSWKIALFIGAFVLLGAAVYSFLLCQKRELFIKEVESPLFGPKSGKLR
jgi:MFS family permease